MKPDETKWLPSPAALEEWLQLTTNRGIADLIEQSLLAPLKEFLNRPSKHFRGQLVQCGYDLASRSQSDNQYVEGAKNILEAIHAASLVVDDIQDNSEWRRGQPTLHRTHGLAVALNSANWLYFWPFEAIEEWELSSQIKHGLTRACHRALIRAHSGQALDVGTPISDLPQERVPSVCLASLELKTGALTSLALELGAILAETDSKSLGLLSQLGADFGVALQMFDDLGNVRETKTADPKRFEDLKGKRPSWVWASAALHLSKKDYSDFKRVVETLPDQTELNAYFRSASWLQEANEKAKEFLDSALGRLDPHRWNEAAIQQMLYLGEVLKRSYG